jgi:hypothetical protein
MRVNHGRPIRARQAHELDLRRGDSWHVDEPSALESHDAGRHSRSLERVSQRASIGHHCEELVASALQLNGLPHEPISADGRTDDV